MQSNKEPLPRALQTHFRALANNAKNAKATNEKLKALQVRRHEIVLKIFDELEKDPAKFTHVTRKGRAETEERLTRSVVKKLRKQYEAAYAKLDIPNPHGGPGCSDCEDIFECWCMFGAGPLCCYLCFSWKVIRCYF